MSEISIYVIIDPFDMCNLNQIHNVARVNYVKTISCSRNNQTTIDNIIWELCKYIAYLYIRLKMFITNSQVLLVLRLFGIWLGVAELPKNQIICEWLIRFQDSSAAHSSLQGYGRECKENDIRCCNYLYFGWEHYCHWPVKSYLTSKPNLSMWARWSLKMLAICLSPLNLSVHWWL